MHDRVHCLWKWWEAFLWLKLYRFEFPFLSFSCNNARSIWLDDRNDFFMSIRCFSHPPHKISSEILKNQHLHSHARLYTPFNMLHASHYERLIIKRVEYNLVGIIRLYLRKDVVPIHCFRFSKILLFDIARPTTKTPQQCTVLCIQRSTAFHSRRIAMGK